MLNIKWVPSPNYEVGREGKTAKYLVLHHSDGTLEAADATFQDTLRATSAHYGVARDGRIHQWVHETDTAWAVGVHEANLESISIEHEDLGTDSYTELQYKTSATPYLLTIYISCHIITLL